MAASFSSLQAKWGQQPAMSWHFCFLQDPKSLFSPYTPSQTYLVILTGHQKLSKTRVHCLHLWISSCSTRADHCTAFIDEYQVFFFPAAPELTIQLSHFHFFDSGMIRLFRFGQWRQCWQLFCVGSMCETWKAGWQHCLFGDQTEPWVMSGGGKRGFPSSEAGGGADTKVANLLFPAHHHCPNLASASANSCPRAPSSPKV